MKSSAVTIGITPAFGTEQNQERMRCLDENNRLISNAVI